MTEVAPARERRPADDRRDALVLAAFTRIAQQGFEGLRTRAVAADAGVNIATLHYYFPTKEALIRGVLQHAMRRFAATLPRQGSPAEQLQGHFAVLSQLLKENAALCTVLCELWLRAPRDPTIAQIVDEMDDAWTATLRRLLQRGVGEGGLRADLDVDGTAALIVAAIRGASMPSASTLRSERIDHTFRQLALVLGLQPLA